MWYSERRRGRRSSDSIGLACGPGTGIAVRADAAYRPYNIWRQQVKTTGLKHFGNSEVRWVDNLLYLYTQPFDVVAAPRLQPGPFPAVGEERLRGLVRQRCMKLA